MVGAISPMNATNRRRDAEFFMPHPWTSTPVAGSFLMGPLPPVQTDEKVGEPDRLRPLAQLHALSVAGPVSRRVVATSEPRTIALRELPGLVANACGVSWSQPAEAQARRSI